MDPRESKAEIIEALYKDVEKEDTAEAIKEESKKPHLSIKKCLQGCLSVVGFVIAKFYSILRFSVVAFTMFLMIFMAMNYKSYKERIDYWWDATAAVEVEDVKDVVNTALLKEEPKISIKEDISDVEVRSQEARKDSKSKLPLPKMNLKSISFNVAPPDNRLIIPKIERNIPIVHATSRDDDVVMKALEDGIVHYPDTAYPGEIGNVFLTGHSSYYPWAEGKFKTALALLDKLVVGDSIVAYSKGEKYLYTIYDVFVVEPDDLSVLDQPTDQKILTLMTCTPVGTNARRLIIRARQQN